MTADRPHLLRAVCACPDDDTPRLAYADHLEEYEPRDEARAEFVRAQVELARIVTVRGGVEYAMDHDRVKALRRREGELFAAHGRAWFLVPPVSWVNTPAGGAEYVGGTGRTISASVSRGFVSHLTLPLSAFTEAVARRVFAEHPVAAVTLSGAAPYHNGAGWAWYDVGRERNSGTVPDTAELPTAIYQHLRGWLQGRIRGLRWKPYLTPELATAELSAACIAWGRSPTGRRPGRAGRAARGRAEGCPPDAH